jgi:hypothetical protein
MIVGSNQPYLFPYIGYWQLINLSEVYVISDSMQYIKKGYINRNNILIDGKKYLFTLEVLGVHSNTPINKVIVGGNAKKVAKSIFHAYKKAPYFNKIYPLIEEIVLNKEKNLAKYLGYSIETISNYLGIETNFIYLSRLQGETDLKAEERTIDICKRVGATHYINAIGGVKLYSKERFLKEGIELSFLQTKEIKYKQFNNKFIPNLSIIDIMMFNSKKEIKEILTKFDLIKNKGL